MVHKAQSSIHLQGAARVLPAAAFQPPSCYCQRRRPQPAPGPATPQRSCRQLGAGICSGVRSSLVWRGNSTACSRVSSTVLTKEPACGACHAAQRLRAEAPREVGRRYRIDRRRPSMLPSRLLPAQRFVWKVGHYLDGNEQVHSPRHIVCCMLASSLQDPALHHPAPVVFVNLLCLPAWSRARSAQPRAAARLVPQPAQSPRLQAPRPLRPAAAAPAPPALPPTVSTMPKLTLRKQCIRWPPEPALRLHQLWPATTSAKAVFELP